MTVLPVNTIEATKYHFFRISNHLGKFSLFKFKSFHKNIFKYFKILNTTFCIFFALFCNIKQILGKFQWQNIYFVGEVFLLLLVQI